MQNNKFGYVTIHKYKERPNNDRVSIACYSDILEGHVQTVIADDSIIFIRVGIDYVGKSRKLARQSKNSYATSLSALDSQKTPEGKFYFDEDDSNEDILIAYFD